VHLTGGLSGSATVLISSAVTMLTVGLAEETVSRGLVQRLLQPRGPAVAAVWVGVLFGLGHLLSGLWFERPLDDVAFQVGNTAAYGFCLAAVRWHVGTLWPLVVLHALVDVTSINSPGALPFAVQCVIVVLLVGYGGWLLRRLGRADQTGDDLRGEGDQGQPPAGVRGPADQEQPGHGGGVGRP
jgi:membrane protease YdiL (CAAX protease family)